VLVVSMRDRKLLRLEYGELVEHADLSGLTGGHVNDMVVDGHGRAYVGNFGFDLMGGAAVRATTIVRVDPDGTASVAADGLMFPNGSVITPDGSGLGVAADAAARRMRQYLRDHGTPARDGFLEGAAGIALVGTARYIAGSAARPGWDTCLLLS
jgi:sugar lactone lactonase YvrE